jgi:hypothetical protein
MGPASVDRHVTSRLSINVESAVDEKYIDENTNNNDI